MKWLLILLSLLPGATAVAATVSAQGFAASGQATPATDSWQLFASLALAILGPVSLWYMRKMSADLKETQNKLPQQADAMNVKMGLMESRVSALERDLKERTRERDEAMLQTNSYRNENRLLRDELATERQGREELTQRTTEQEKRINEQSANLAKQQAEITELKRQIDSYKDVNTLASTILSGMKDLLELVKHSTNEHKAVLETPPATS